MRTTIIVSALMAVMILASKLVAQDSTRPGWKPCPRCVLDSKNAEAVAGLKDHAFDPHDLSGVWGNNDLLLDTRTVPPMTAWGKEQYEGTKAEETAAGI